jgi:adenylate kinase
VEETRLVLLGPPACGKGTQGRLLSEAYGLSYFSTGKQLRLEVEADSELGREADTYLSRTEYVPDRLALDLVSGWLAEARGGWILDGFPRTVPQAVAMDAFSTARIGGMRALLIDVEREVLAERVAQRCECSRCSWVGTLEEVRERGHCPDCGGGLNQRRDDAPEAFQKRMDVYEELSLPVVGYYEATDRLLRVSGIGSPEEVFTRMRSALSKHG